MRPTRYKREFAVAQTVADMKRRFVYPDEDTKPANPVVGGGGGAPTIVAAAADATDISKRKADLLCVGVNDQEVLQSAVAQMPIGGRLVLTEGTFRFSGTLDLVFAIHMMGMSVGVGGGTNIVPTTSNIGPLVQIGPSSRVSDLEFFTTHGFNNVTLVELEGFRSSMFRCGVTGSNAVTGTIGVLITQELIHVSDNDIVVRNGGTAVHIDRAVGSTSVGIHFTENQVMGDLVVANSLQECVITDNRIFGFPLDIAGDITFTEIANNAWFSRITCDGMFESVISNNVIINNTNYAVDIGPANYAGIVTGNIAIGGIRWEDTYMGQITGNIIGAYPHGVVLTPGSFGSEYVRVSDNLIEQWASGGDGVRVEGAAQSVNVRDNQILSYGNMAHGINVIDSTCNDAVVYANDLGDRSAYTTADFVDGGTGTQTGPGGDGQFGF